jgi:ABC-type transport system substrate-binding protein
VPKEAENVDLRNRVIGTGPWALANYQPSIGVTWKRHAEFYDKTLPYFDQIENPILPEYAAGLAQFTQGRLHAFAVRQEDILQAKKDAPLLNLYVTDVSDPSLLTQYGWDASVAENKPWRDERVRQAYSMSLDRDLWIDTFYNVGKFQQEGLPSEAVWATTFQASLPFSGWVLNPKDEKSFGPNARYYRHDVAEARKLLSAAGYGSGVEATSSFVATIDQRQVSVLESMASDSGFKFNDRVIPSAEDANNRDSKGKNRGIAHVQKPVVSSGGSDPLEAMIRLFSVKANSRYYLGFDKDGKGDFSGDAFLDDLLLKARGEFDVQKRKAAVHETQRYVAKAQYLTRFPGGAPLFALRWPAVQNFNVFKGDSRADMTLWLDQTRPPFVKS